jgi:cell shape-determining protein MreC
MVEIYRPPRPVVFALLMVASFVTMMLPPESLSAVRNLTQPLAALQLLSFEASQELDRIKNHVIRRPVSAAQHDELVAERDALRRENVALHDQNAQLQATISELAGLRKQGFPAHGLLIPARVIALDAAPGRESLVAGKGDLQKVEQNDWVVSKMRVNAGSEEGVSEQSSVLARQCLIGWVDQVAPLTSRVVLLSDRLANRRRKVLIVPGNGREMPPSENPDIFALEPLGGGKMIITDIPAAMVDSGRVGIGDLVTSPPDDSKLPLAVVIGPITDLKLNREKPVVYDAIVSHMVDPKSLSQVFIVDLSAPATLPEH